jgi:5-methylcytosine-specific restriction endonuclease McrA
VEQAVSDLLVVQLFRRARWSPRRRGRGLLARWWRSVVRGLRWRGARGKTSGEYGAFMRSPAWSAQRARVLRRDGYRCRWCGARGREAHHHYYSVPIAATPDEAITTLCETCHLRAHKDKRQAPTSRRLF